MSTKKPSTPEQREKGRLVAAARLAKETPEQKQERLRKGREHYKRTAETRKRYQKDRRQRLKAAGEMSELDKAKWSNRILAKATRPRPDACEICGDNSKLPVFDHCHTDDTFRGWICQPCNMALGGAKDNIDTLLKLAKYLQDHNDAHHIGTDNFDQPDSPMVQ